MQWYKNLKMRNKLSIAFSLLVFFAIVMGAIGLFGITKINNSYKKAMTGASANVELSSNILSLFMQNRVIIRNDIIDSYSSATTTVDMSDINENNQTISGYIESYKELAVNEPGSSSFTVEELDTLSGLIADYARINQSIFDFTKTGDMEAAAGLLNGAGAEKADVIIGMMEGGYKKATELSDASITSNQEAANGILWQLGIVMVVIILVSAAMSLYIAAIITKPIKQLINSSQKVADGDFKISLALNSKDEIGQLSRSFEQVVQVFDSIDDDLGSLYNEFQEVGNVEARLDESKYKGDYQLITKRINGVIGSLIEDTLGLLNVLKKYGNGDFEATMPKFPGKKALMNETLDELQGNLMAISNDVKSLIDSAQKGELEVRLDGEKYNGDWKSMALGMNHLLDGIIEPIKETIDVLTEMSKGNLNVSIQGDYKGEYLKMKQAVNATLISLAEYITEISFVLDAMSREDFDLEIEKEYVGDFAAIKRSLLQIISTFNDLLGNINMSTNQVSQGAKQISQSSMILAQGASEQAGAIDKLTVMLNEVNKKTADNAQNAVKANELAENAKENAGTGSKEMGEMLSSMNEIDAASQNISKIIKVIEDIAFQTNLLALNAAVEAARAGQHGKGFAVVADQVRSLAGRSKDAAQETTALIEGTVEKVSQGMKLANKTSEVLEKIVSQIGDISGIVGGVAASSNEQARAISDINDNIVKISQVTQANTATSEQAAAASQELLSQSDVLKDQVYKFKLKKAKPEAKAEKVNNMNTAAATSIKPEVAEAVKPAAASNVKPAAASAVKPATASVNNVKPTATEAIKPVVTNVKQTVVSQANTKAPGLKPSLPQKAIARPEPDNKPDSKPDNKPTNKKEDSGSKFVTPKRQSSGAPAIKNDSELYSRIGSQTFESKDFGKYS